MTLQSEVYALIPGHVDEEAEKARTAQLRRDLNRAEWVHALQRAEHQVQALLQTSHDVTEIRDAIAAREAARVNTVAFEEIQHSLNALGGQRRQDRLRGEADLAPALEFLNSRLGELMARVRDLDSTLGPVRDIETALHGNDKVIAAWRDLTSAVDEYEEIRRLQTAVTYTLFDGKDAVLSEALRESGRIRNAFDHDAPWVHQRHVSRRGRLQESTVNRALLDWVAIDTLPAWERQPMDVWPAEDRPGYLRWMATTAHPWVPTHEELERAHTALQRLVGPVSGWDQLAAALDAYDDYYTKRGVQPLRPLDVASIRASMERPKVSIR